MAALDGCSAAGVRPERHGHRHPVLRPADGYACLRDKGMPRWFFRSIRAPGEAKTGHCSDHGRSGLEIAFCAAWCCIATTAGTARKPKPYCDSASPVVLPDRSRHGSLTVSGTARLIRCVLLRDAALDLKFGRPATFQDLILTLQEFWARQGCLILQPYDMEVGAGTSHPATTLRALGPRPWRAAYVQPSRRPKDGRYGENPNRLQHYYQYQVILKPSPDDVQDIYLRKPCKTRDRSRAGTTSASSRTIGKIPRWAPGDWGGKCGAMAWK